VVNSLLGVPSTKRNRGGGNCGSSYRSKEKDIFYWGSSYEGEEENQGYLVKKSTLGLDTA